MTEQTLPSSPYAQIILNNGKETIYDKTPIPAPRIRPTFKIAGTSYDREKHVLIQGGPNNGRDTGKERPTSANLSIRDIVLTSPEPTQ